MSRLKRITKHESRIKGLLPSSKFYIPNSGEAGYTLVELIFVIMITGVMVVVLGNFLVATLNSYQYAQAQASASNDTLNLMGRMSKVIRGTTGVVSAGANDMTVYAYFSPRDNVPDKIRYYVSGTTLYANVIPATGAGPTYTYDPANAQLKTLTTNLALSGAVVFTYYDDLGNLLSGSFATTQIKQIGIYISVNPKPFNLPVGISNQTKVTLRNMKTNL